MLGSDLIVEEVPGTGEAAAEAEGGEGEGEGGAAKPKKRKAGKRGGEAMSRPMPAVFFCHKRYTSAPVCRFEDIPPQELDATQFLAVDGDTVTQQCPCCSFHQSLVAQARKEATVIGECIGQSSSNVPKYNAMVVGDVTYAVRPRT